MPRNDLKNSVCFRYLLTGYVEGHKGLDLLSKNLICLKLKKGRIKIEGKDFVLRELYDDCIKISGKIEKIEVFDAEN